MRHPEQKLAASVRDAIEANPDYSPYSPADLSLWVNGWSGLAEVNFWVSPIRPGPFFYYELGTANRPVRLACRVATLRDGNSTKLLIVENVMRWARNSAFPEIYEKQYNDVCVQEMHRMLERLKPLPDSGTPSRLESFNEAI